MAQLNLFHHIDQPLADKMRPQTLDQMVGQEHLIGPSKPLYQIITQHIPINLLLWGPPGTGKTTFAHVMSKTLLSISCLIICKIFIISTHCKCAAPVV